jgi:hypothetical protein
VIGLPVPAERHHHDHCLPVSADGGGNEDSGLSTCGGLHRRVTAAEDEVAERHRRDRPDDLRDNPAGK